MTSPSFGDSFVLPGYPPLNPPAPSPFASPSGTHDFVTAADPGTLGGARSAIVDSGIKKFSAFEAHIARHLGMGSVPPPHPSMEVLLTGSYIHQPANLRAGSDVDMLVLSRELKDPAAYVSFLEGLNALGRTLVATTGNIPVFFTQAANENAFCYVASGAHGARMDRIVPCHFLYYGDRQELFEREPLALAGRLLGAAKTVTPPTDAPQPVDLARASQARSPLERLRWDVERAVAELVLNRGLLPEEFLVMHYTDRMISALRALRNDDPLGSGSAFEGINILDPDGREKLQEASATLFAIRTFGYTAFADMDSLIVPARTILKIVA